MFRPANSQDLTASSDWDAYWSSICLPNLIDPRSNHVMRCMDRVFHRFLPYNPQFRFLEIGCAPGRWLVYFSREFGYRVAGCDISPMGLQLTRKNLELCEVEPLGIWQGRADETGARSESFNTVASFGLIEHFMDPTSVLQEHVRLLKPGGYLILEIPNWQGLNLIVQKIANPQFLRWHNTTIMTLDFLRRVATDLRLEIVFLDLIGGFTPSDYYFVRPPFVKDIINLIVRVISKIRHPMEFIDQLNSPLLSGYMMAIFQK